MEKTKPKEQEIMYQLINHEHNKEVLKQLPHIRYLDMAIIFYYWEGEDRESAHIVSKRNMQQWEYSIEELEKIATKNTPRSMPVSFQPMEEVIRQLLGDEFCEYEEDEESKIPMHILTNKEKIFGAASILYPQVLWAVSQTLDSDLYILPSSIHECIIVPTSVNCSKEELEEIVCDINKHQVPKEEVLSNHVFIYQKEEDSIRL